MGVVNPGRGMLVNEEGNFNATGLIRNEGVGRASSSWSCLL